MFVSFEGPDGVGKTTQAALLVERLRASGARVVTCREPGGTPLGERVRGLLLDGDVDICPRAEALLFQAARAQLVERVIRPALEVGAVVVCDRFFDSSIAYQGGGRRLGVDAVAALSRFATGGLVPDRTLLLSGPVWRPGVSDRIEAEGQAFRERVRTTFDALAVAEPGRFAVIDAAASEADVASAIWAAVQWSR